MIHSEVFTHPTWAESALYFTINVGAVLFVFLNVFYYVVLTFFLSIFFRSFSFSFFRPLLLLQVGKLIIGALPSVTFSFFSCDDKARFKILSWTNRLKTHRSECCTELMMSDSTIEKISFPNSFASSSYTSTSFFFHHLSIPFQTSSKSQHPF